MSAKDTHHLAKKMGGPAICGATNVQGRTWAAIGNFVNVNCIHCIKKYLKRHSQDNHYFKDKCFQLDMDELLE